MPPSDAPIRLNLAPGPSRIWPFLPDAAREFLAAGLGGLHHRTPELCALVERLVDRLRICLELPEDHSVWFVSSGSYAMELAIRNLTRSSCHALSAGAFGDRFATIAGQLGRRVETVRLPAGATLAQPPADADWASSEAWLLCHNETATGTRLPLEDWPEPRPEDPLRVVDCVSSAGAVRLPWRKGDCWFFGVQKGFGCPPGLAVLVAGPRARRRALELDAEGRDLGAWFSFPRLEENARRHQSPCTPNSLGLHLLCEAAARLAEEGSAAVEGRVRAMRDACLAWLEEHPVLEPCVAEPAARSLTVTALRRRDGAPLEELRQALRRQGVVVGGGYGDWKAQSLRLAHFPAHCEEDGQAVRTAIDAALGC